MLRTALLLALVLTTACASDLPTTGVQASRENSEVILTETSAEVVPTSAADPATAAPATQTGSPAEADGGGLTTGQKVAIGIGSGAIAGVLLYAIIIGVGTAALMSGMSGG